MQRSVFSGFQEERNSEAPFPNLKRVQFLYNPYKKQTLILVHESHKVYDIETSDNGKITSPLNQKNPISELYKKIYELLQVPAEGFSKFLGIVEIESTGSFLYGGDTTSANSLVVAYECMMEIFAKLKKEDRQAAVLRADLRDSSDEGWGEALSTFAHVYQDLGEGKNIFKRKCSMKLEKIKRDLELSKEIILEDKPLQTEIDEVDLRMTQYLSRFFRKPLAYTWKSQRKLSELAASDYLTDFFYRRLKTLFQRYYPKVEKVVDSLQKQCLEERDIGFTRDEYDALEIAADLTARVMDLNVLHWIDEAPENTCIVVHAGAAHTSFISAALQILSNFTLVSDDVGVLQESTYQLQDSGEVNNQKLLSYILRQKLVTQFRASRQNEELPEIVQTALDELVCTNDLDELFKFYSKLFRKDLP